MSLTASEQMTNTAIANNSMCLEMSHPIMSTVISVHPHAKVSVLEYIHKEIKQYDVLNYSLLAEIQAGFGI